MKKLLVIGTIMLLAFMMGGLQFTGDDLLSVLWSTTTEYQIIRLALTALLLGLLFSTPPRSMYFRILLAVVATVLLSGSLVMLLNYQMYALDAVMFIEIAIILAIEAIESPAYLRLSTKKEQTIFQA
ncbi:hypothetical protein D3C84_903160 [compost metagenome]